MKNIVFILMLFPTLLFSQVRTGNLEPDNTILEPGFGFGECSNTYYEIKFQEADSAFDSLIIELSIPIGQRYNPNVEKLDIVSDIVFSDSTDSITVTVNQILQLYWMGYIDGTINTFEKGNFDRDGLRLGILSNKRSINSHFNK